MIHTLRSSVIRLLICTAFLLVRAGATLGEEETDRHRALSPEEEFLFSEEEIVVSAAKYEQSIGMAPSTIYVITEEDIRQSGLTSIPDILRVVPGIDVMALSATQYDVSARGFINQAPSNRMLVMIDGRPVFNASNNFVIWGALPVVLADIRQIEVVVGPGSALYGANAFSGLINIRTKDPERARTVHYTGFTGTEHTLSQSVLGGATWDRLGFKVSASWDKTDRWDEDEEAGKAVKTNVSMEYKLADEDLIRLAGSMIKGTTEFFVDRPLGFFDLDDLEMYFLSFLAKWKGLQLQTMYDSGNMDWLQRDYPHQSYPIRYDVVNVQSQYTLSPAEWCKFVVGGDYRSNHIDWEHMLDKEHSLDDYSAFGQAVFFPFESTSLTLGGRYDNYRPVGDQWSYRASVIQSITKEHNVRFSYGNAFRTPSYPESYWAIRMPYPDPRIPIPGLTLGIDGNSDLDSEYIDTFELAYQGKLFKGRLSVRSTLFYNEMEDFIYARVLDGIPFPPIGGVIPTKIGLVNFGNARSYGGEFSLDVRWTKELASFVNYAYQHLEFTEDDPYTPEDEKGNRITTTPTHKVNWGIRLVLENGISANLNAHYVSSTEWKSTLWPLPINSLDGYVLLNTRVGYRFLDEKCEVALSVFNLLNDVHVEYPSGEGLGRKLFLSVHLDF